MRLLPHEVALGILEDSFEEGYFPDPRTAFDGKAGAAEFLQLLTGEDFGENPAQWRTWFDECPSEMLRLYYDELSVKAKAIADTRRRRRDA